LVLGSREALWIVRISTVALLSLLVLAAVKKDAFYYQFGSRQPPQPLLTSIQDIILIRHLAYFQPGESRLYQAYCNLSRPAQSLFLQAPLSKTAGGLGLCGSDVFAEPADADYQTILAAIAKAAGQLAASKRFNLTGFVPNGFYIDQMQNFGILPRPLPPGYQIDVYATDQAYWRSCQLPFSCSAKRLTVGSFPTASSTSEH